MHQIKCLVNLPKGQSVSDVFINFNFLQRENIMFKLISLLIIKSISHCRTLSDQVTFFKYFSTSQGTCERLLKPPNTVPFHTRPVTSWKGRVDISCPDAETPTITDVPQPCKFFNWCQDLFCTHAINHQSKQQLPYGSTPRQPSSLRHSQCTQSYSQLHHQWDQLGPVGLACHGPLDSRIQ